LLRLIIFVILCYILYRLVKSLALPSPKKPGKSPIRSSETITDEMVMDPNCHVYIPKREAIKAKIAGETIYFCSKECKKKYLKEKNR
jgi:uncharacterized protein